MALKALIVLGTTERLWVREMELPFPPFPGLGIRVDTYEVLNVESVVVGDRGYDVTCITRLDGAEPATEAKCRALGFEPGDYP
jgi:hypothetical protein